LEDIGIDIAFPTRTILVGLDVTLSSSNIF